MPDPTPIALPQELIDQLNDAESSLQEAKADDAAHDQAQAALMLAQKAEADAADAAMKAHGVSNQKASAFIDAIKAHFGLQGG